MNIENQEYNENYKNLKNILNKIEIGMMSSAVGHFI